MSYVLEVANSISSQLRCGAILGPEIYTAIAEWEKKEIPLPIVLASVDEFCDETGRLEGEFESIDIFKAVVNKNFRNWLTEQ